MPTNRAESTTAESVDNPLTPASEPARSQPPSPTKKRRKVSRSQSIPAQPSNASSFYPPPNVYAPTHDAMMVHHPYEDPMHGGPMTNPSMHMAGHMGPHPGHPMMHGGGPIPPHMQHPGLPHPGNGGHPGRYMRQSSVPMAPPHMSPHGAAPGLSPMHPQGMSPHMGGHMPPGGPPVSGPMSAIPQQYSPGMAPNISNCVYPPDQPMIFNQQNPHAPPIYPCGMCHKEVCESDQAILCESGCNFWFHRQCTGLTETAFQLLTNEVYAEWGCDHCFATKNIPLIKIKP